MSHSIRFMESGGGDHTLLCILRRLVKPWVVPTPGRYVCDMQKGICQGFVNSIHSIFDDLKEVDQGVTEGADFHGLLGDHL